MAVSGYTSLLSIMGTPKDYDVIAEMCRGNITFVNGLLLCCNFVVLVGVGAVLVYGLWLCTIVHTYKIKCGHCQLR
jgi:hypothetical protein